MYTVQCYSATKKNKALPFVTTRTDLEHILISEGQTDKDKYCMIPTLYMESKIKPKQESKKDVKRGLQVQRTKRAFYKCGDIGDEIKEGGLWEYTSSL